MRPPEGFTWKQKDAGKLRCEDCGETVNAVTVDLHNCDRKNKAVNPENPQTNRFY